MAKIYRAGANVIVLAGLTYVADADGIIDVPDDLVNAAYQKGFSPAKGRQEQLARQKQEAEAEEKLKGQPAAVAPPPPALVAKQTTKPTGDDNK